MVQVSLSIAQRNNSRQSAPLVAGLVLGMTALVQNTWARIFSARLLVNASVLCNELNDFDGFIGIVAKRVLSVAVAKGFFDPFTDLFFGFFAATADGGECGEVEFLIFDLVDECSGLSHGFV